jgi:hypothetical protein
MKMKPITRSIVIGILLVLVAAFIGGVGIAVALLNPFGEALSLAFAVSLIGSAFICWGWACFAREELYE